MYELYRLTNKLATLLRFLEEIKAECDIPSVETVLYDCQATIDFDTDDVDEINYRSECAKSILQNFNEILSDYIKDI